MNQQFIAPDFNLKQIETSLWYPTNISNPIVYNQSPTAAIVSTHRRAYTNNTSQLFQTRTSNYINYIQRINMKKPQSDYYQPSPDSFQNIQHNDNSSLTQISNPNQTISLQTKPIKYIPAPKVIEYFSPHQNYSNPSSLIGNGLFNDMKRTSPSPSGPLFGVKTYTQLAEQIQKKDLNLVSGDSTKILHKLKNSTNDSNMTQKLNISQQNDSACQQTVIKEDQKHQSSNIIDQHQDILKTSQKVAHPNDSMKTEMSGSNSIRQFSPSDHHYKPEQNSKILTNLPNSTQNIYNSYTKMFNQNQSHNNLLSQVIGGPSFNDSIFNQSPATPKDLNSILQFRDFFMMKVSSGEKEKKQNKRYQKEKNEATQQDENQYFNVAEKPLQTEPNIESSKLRESYQTKIQQKNATLKQRTRPFLSIRIDDEQNDRIELSKYDEKLQKQILVQTDREHNSSQPFQDYSNGLIQSNFQNSYQKDSYQQQSDSCKQSRLQFERESFLSPKENKTNQKLEPVQFSFGNLNIKSRHPVTLLGSDQEYCGHSDQKVKMFEQIRDFPLTRNIQSEIQFADTPFVYILSEQFGNSQDKKKLSFEFRSSKNHIDSSGDKGDIDTKIQELKQSDGNEFFVEQSTNGSKSKQQKETKRGSQEQPMEHDTNQLNNQFILVSHQKSQSNIENYISPTQPQDSSRVAVNEKKNTSPAEEKLKPSHKKNSKSEITFKFINQTDLSKQPLYSSQIKTKDSVQSYSLNSEFVHEDKPIVQTQSLSQTNLEKIVKLSKLNDETDIELLIEKKLLIEQNQDEFQKQIQFYESENNKLQSEIDHSQAQRDICIQDYQYLQKVINDYTRQNALQQSQLRNLIEVLISTNKVQN